MVREYFDKARDIDRGGNLSSRKRSPIIHAPDRRKYSHISYMDVERDITTKDFFESGEGVHKLSTKHPTRPKRHHRGEKLSHNPSHQEKKDGLSQEKIALRKHDKYWVNQQIRDAFLPHDDDEISTTVVDEQIAQEELDYIFDDEDAWVDWQNGERFDGAQSDGYDDQSNVDDETQEEETALQRILEAERMFQTGQSWRRPQSRGRVQATTGSTNKPVPGKTPGYSS